MKKLFPILLTVVLVISLVAVGCSPADVKPNSAEEFYKGKTITLHTSAAGSGMEIASRHMADYLGKEIGANVVVEQWDKNPAVNIFNTVYRAEPDGLTMGGHQVTSSVQNWLLEDPTVLYKADEMTWLGSWVYPPMALWTKAEGDYPTVEALMAGKDLFMGGASPLGYVSLWGTLAGHILGLDFNTVIGVGGPPPLKLSILRDETQFTCLATHDIEAYWVPLIPDLAPVVMIANERTDLFPDVPTIGEVVTLTEEEELWLDLATLVSIYNAPAFVFPPGVDQDKVDYLRKVLDNIATDPEFIKDTQEKFGSWGWKTATELETGVQFFLDNEDTLWDIHGLLQEYRAQVK